MKPEKFNALLHLLDDTDPEVKHQVENELFTLGDSLLERLEAAQKEIDDSALQQQIETFINRLQHNRFTDELLAWRKSGGKDLLEGWLLLTEFKYPTLNVQKYRDAINRIVNKTWLQISAGMNDLEKLCVVNKLMYGIEAFNGNYEEPDAADSNFLSHVLDLKMGNSLSLSALYAIICEKLDIPLQVVNFKGYYALRYYSKKSHFYIDAYNKGLFFTPEQVQRFLGKLNANDNVFTYKPLSNIYVVLHFVQSLIGTYKQSGGSDYEREARRFNQLLDDIDISF